MTVLYLWLWLRGGKGRLVVANMSFFLCCDWWLLPVEKWQKRKVVWAWIMLFFSSSYCRSLWLWMVGQQWKWLLLLCCDGLVFFFFFYPLLLRFLDLEFVAVVAVDVVTVVNDNGEEIIYYFNV